MTRNKERKKKFMRPLLQCKYYPVANKNKKVLGKTRRETDNKGHNQKQHGTVGSRESFFFF